MQESDYMKTSKAHNKAVNKYICKHYDRVNLTLPKGDKAIIKQLAASRGMSVNGFIKSILSAEIARYKTESKPQLRLHKVKKKQPIDTD